MENKQYIIKKYILAPSLHAALCKEPDTPVDECYIDHDHKNQGTASAIGFEAAGPEYEYEDDD